MRIRLIFTRNVAQGFDALPALVQADLADEMRAYGEVAPVLLLQNWECAGDSPWRQRDEPERGWEIRISTEQLARYLADTDRVATLVAGDYWDLVGTGDALTHSLFVSDSER